MFFFEGEYVSTILLNGTPKLIAKIGKNRVFYNCMNRRLEQIGLDRVVYDNTLGRISKIGELDVLYDAATGCMTKIGSLIVTYDKTGSIVQIGDSTVLYANVPTRFEPVYESYYSPIQADAPMRNHGLGYESANRLRMEGFIDALKDEASVSGALFRIGLNLYEERKARAQHDSLHDGYCTAALDFGAINKVANLLCHRDSVIRSRAQKVLLAFPDCLQITALPRFYQQLKAEALLIINVTLSRLSSLDNRVDTRLYNEARGALELMFILPFEDQEIHDLAREKNLVACLTAIRNTHTALSDVIENNIGKLTINPTRPCARNLAEDFTVVDLASVQGSEQGMTVRQLTKKLDNKSSSSSNPDVPNPSKVTVEALKVYYDAHSIWSKQKKHIFKNGADLSGVVQTLRVRADQRPGYASDKTLSHFKLK